MSDNNKVSSVNHPNHYNGYTSLECIDVMVIAFGVEAVRNFCLCNALKYLWRYKNKNGSEDIEKADWYLSYYAHLSMYDSTENKEQYKQFEELRNLCNRLMKEEGVR